MSCPTVDELAAQVEAQAPRGVAWGTDGAEAPATSPRRGVWRAIARALFLLNERICALGEEIFCATASETVDSWLAEYGLPDACDPSGGDLCAKVALVGGGRIADLEEGAARYGYDLAIYDPAPRVRIRDDGYYTPGLMPGVEFDLPLDLPGGASEGAALAGAAQAGCAFVGTVEGCAGDRQVMAARLQPVIPWAYTIRCTMSAATSAALGNKPPTSAGCAMAGCSRAGYRPDFSALDCILAGVAPAHVRIVFEII